MPSRSTVCLCPHARQHRAHRAACFPASRSYRRSYETANAFYRTLDSRSRPPTSRRAARKYFTDAGLIVTTLVEGAAAGRHREGARAYLDCAAVAVPARGASAQRGAAACRRSLERGRRPAPDRTEVRSCRSSTSSSSSPAGSAHDPAGKEGLAALTAAMIADAGSRSMTIDQIEAIAVPDGGLVRRTDRQGDDRPSPASIHRDNWRGVPRHRCCRSCSTPASATRTSSG